MVEGEWTGDGPRVAVIGDSLAHQTRDELRAELDGYSLRVDAIVGATAANTYMQDVAENIGQGDPEVVVVVLGTNDAWTLHRLDDSLAGVDRIVDAVGDVCVVGVLVNERATADGFDRGIAAALNDRMSEVADVTVDQDMSTLEPIGIHPLTERRADWVLPVADGVKSC